MKTPASKKNLLTLLGNPADANRNLQSFRKTARILSSHHRRFIDKYPQQWVVVCDGEVAAHGTTLSGVLKEMERKKIPQERTIIHFVEKIQRTMILWGLCSMADLGTPAGGLILKRK